MSLVARTRLLVELLGSMQWHAPLTTEVDLSALDGGLYERTVADGSTNVALTFPGITTLTMLWLTTDKAISVTLGPIASNQARTVSAGGLIGFAKGSLTASTGVSVSYTPGDTSVANITVFAAGT
jgi:hypothetical protein